MTLNELTEIKITAAGETQPRVDSGTAVLLIQGGKVSVGKLNYNSKEFFSTEIEHPINQKELNVLATEIIKSKKPELLKSDISHVITCPTNLRDIMSWKK